MKYLKVFLLGIGAGIAIAFGGAAYTACTYYGSEIAGSVLFSCGLLLVCSFGMKLYTGQIGWPSEFENATTRRNCELV
jgi:formate/nitrite transporter FocA (FNT family)